MTAAVPEVDQVDQVVDDVRPRRDRALDAVRGLAVLLMVVDHVALFLPAGDVYRFTLGRLAMPLFFVLAGYLARRVSWRTGWAFLLGAVLPAAAPFLDSPNVLCWYAVGVVVLVALRRWKLSPAWAVLVALVAGANGWDVLPGSFGPAALVALMACGALARDAGYSWSWAGRLPAWLSRVGRYPLTVYVGHALALTVILTAVR